MLDQECICGHLQTSGVAVFDRARGCYAAMLAEVARPADGQAGRVLNFGIGPGHVGRHLVAGGWTVAAFDPSLRVVERVARGGVDRGTAGNASRR